MSVKKPPRKKSIMKPLIAGGMITFLAIAGILGSIALIYEDELVIGMDGLFDSIDPLYLPDDLSFTADIMIWTQVIEGLYEYNQSNSAEIIPCLAKDMGTWSVDGLNFTCQLKEDVLFHDGTSCNASAVKWNFDRLYTILNTKSWYNTFAWSYAYLLPDGCRLINETLVLDDLTIRFVLNAPYSVFRALLTTLQSSILSPTSTPENNFISKLTGRMIGTGPFMMDSWVLDPISLKSGDITIIANKNYWGGRPWIDKIRFLTLNIIERIEKIITREIHYTKGPYDLTILDYFNNSPKFNIIPVIASGISTIAMNNDIFPLEMRKAISFAINYTNCIQNLIFSDEIRRLRCRSPLSKDMRYSNWSFDIADYNIQIARQVLIDAGWPGTSGLTANDNITTGNEWELLVDNETPLASYCFSIKFDNDYHYMIQNLIAEYLKQIGVNVLPNELSSQEWWDELRLGNLDFYYSAWSPSFNDPVEMLNPLFGYNATYNLCNFTDFQVQQWLEQGLEERNETIRGDIYYNIQKRLVEELYPVVWISSPKIWYIWSSHVQNTPHEDGFSKFYLKNVYLR